MGDVSDFWRRALEANPEVMAGIEESRRELGFYDDEPETGIAPLERGDTKEGIQQ